MKVVGRGLLCVSISMQPQHARCWGTTVVCGLLLIAKKMQCFPSLPLCALHLDLCPIRWLHEACVGLRLVEIFVTNVIVAWGRGIFSSHNKLGPGPLSLLPGH